jgi:hypothetical protein
VQQFGFSSGRAQAEEGKADEGEEEALHIEGRRAPEQERSESRLGEASSGTSGNGLGVCHESRIAASKMYFEAALFCLDSFY